jgi:hypothetical protein
MLAFAVNNQYDNLLSAIHDLERQGYTETFISSNGHLYNTTNGEFYGPQEITVIEFHRFEGSTDYNDMAILYAIEAPDSSKGLIIDAYGTYADQGLGEFMRLTLME